MLRGVTVYLQLPFYLQVQGAHGFCTPSQSNLICFVTQILKEKLQCFGCKTQNKNIHEWFIESFVGPIWEPTKFCSSLSTTSSNRRTLSAVLTLWHVSHKVLDHQNKAGNIMYSSDNLPPLPTDFHQLLAVSTQQRRPRNQNYGHTDLQRLTQRI